MANTARKSPPKGKKSTKAEPIPFPQPAETSVSESQPAEIVEDPPAPSETQTEEVKVKTAGSKSKTGLSFFERVSHQPKDEWGNGQLVIYMYRYQPYTDRRIGGDKAVFVMKYTSPIDEQQVLMEHGSGLYHFKLNRSEQGEERSRPIDHANLEIINKKFPPVIPNGEWVDDPRNKKWAWAAPKGSIFHQDSHAQPAGPAPLDPMAAFDTFTAMQDRIEERMQKDTPDPAAQAQAAVTLMKEVASLVKPAETKSDDGMSKFVLAQITGMQAELAAARARQDALMDKLIEANKAPAKSDGLGTLKEIIATAKEFLPTIKEFLPEGGVSASVVRREKEPWWTGIAQTAIEAVQPAIPVIAHGIMQFANRPKTDAQPAQNGSKQPAVTVTAQAVPAVSEPDIWDLLYNALASDASGEDFAESVTTLFGAMRYKQACMFGEAGLLSMIQNHAVWQRLGPFQDRMPQFIKEFVAYGKDEGDEEEGEDLPDDPAQPEVRNDNEAAIEL